LKIGNVEINGPLALAPMAGVTDMAFRAVCRELGAAYTYSEMVSAKALTFRDKKSAALLRRGEGETPFAAQIFGSEPDVMAEGARLALEISGADVIDINMGCPIGKIVRNGEGSALMRNLPLAAKIIDAVVKAVPVPVTVKFRKGWDKGHVNAVEFAKMAESSGASAVCVHGRTRTQLYSGRSDPMIIAEVKQAVKIPVIASGDIFEPEDAPRIKNLTGADMLMLGRGAMGDPWLFPRALAALEGRPIPKRPPLAERCDTAVRQFEMACADRGEKIGCLEARKHYAWYLSGVPGAAPYKELVTSVNTLEDIYKVTRIIKRELKDAPAAKRKE